MNPFVLLRKPTLAACLLLGIAGARGEVLVAPQPAPVEIRATGYHASVASDGWLTSLRRGGQEFLAPGVSISRGAYFFDAGVVPMQSVTAEEQVVTAAGDTARAAYRFAENAVELELTNNADHGVVFFIVLSDQLEAITGPSGADEVWRQPAVTEEWTSLTVYRGGMRLAISGCDRVWGPWNGEHQVVETRLAAGQTRTITLDVGSASQEQAQRIEQLATPKSIDQPTIRIRSPQEHQVFQRRSRRSGEVLLSGKVHQQGATARYRVTDQASPASGEWSDLPLRPNGEFQQIVAAAAGDWLRVEIEALDGASVVGVEVIEPVGVGEVFLIAGQSNSTNSGEETTEQASGKVAAFDGRRWSLANDPLPGVHDRTQGGSPWPAFGDALNARLGVPIGVASTGFGGTSVGQWQPGGNLYEYTLARAHQLGRGGFRALLWHQGESDFQTRGGVYFARLRNTIESSRADAGWQIPWMVAQASYHNAEHPVYQQIRDAQQQIFDAGIALAGPDTDTLTGDHRDLGGRGIHFSPKGLRAHGRMWAELVGDFIEQELARSEGEQ